MNQNLFEMYIGETINFQKNLTMSIIFELQSTWLYLHSHAAIRSLLQKQHLYRPRRS